MARRRAWISALILVIIGLHALPVLSRQGNRQTRWPFLAWSMYAKSYPPGPVEVVKRRVIGARASGGEEEITYTDVGLPFPTFRALYVLPIEKHDTAAGRALLARLNAARSDSFVTLRLETVRARLAPSGVVWDTLPALSLP